MSEESVIISDSELRKEYSEWMKKHSILPHVQNGYLDNIRLPDVPLIHSQSLADENGDILTFLRGTVTLPASFSKSGREEKFIFAKVLRTFVMLPDLVPDEAGYVIIQS